MLNDVRVFSCDRQGATWGYRVTYFKTFIGLRNQTIRSSFEQLSIDYHLIPLTWNWRLLFLFMILIGTILDWLSPYTLDLVVKKCPFRRSFIHQSLYHEMSTQDCLIHSILIMNICQITLLTRRRMAINLQAIVRGTIGDWLTTHMFRHLDKTTISEHATVRGTNWYWHFKNRVRRHISMRYLLNQLDIDSENSLLTWKRKDFLKTLSAFGLYWENNRKW